MRIRKYTFTGFYPSGNPFLHYYDEHEQTMFTTDIEVSKWDKEPKIGDIVELHDMNDKNGYPTIIAKAFINGKQVYQYSQEKENEAKRKMNAIYDNIKREKGYNMNR